MHAECWPQVCALLADHTLQIRKCLYEPVVSFDPLMSCPYSALGIDLVKSRKQLALEARGALSFLADVGLLCLLPALGALCLGDVLAFEIFLDAISLTAACFLLYLTTKTDATANIVATATMAIDRGSAKDAPATCELRHNSF